MIQQLSNVFSYVVSALILGIIAYLLGRTYYLKKKVNSLLTERLDDEYKKKLNDADIKVSDSDLADLVRDANESR